jgi:hypothetical protein
MAFVRNDHQVLWFTSESALLHGIVESQPNLMDELLQVFQHLFAEPQGLPLPRQRVHRIRLLPDTEPVALMPYRYAHDQKAELE